jgi:subtilisin family serine protease
VPVLAPNKIPEVPDLARRNIAPGPHGDVVIARLRDRADLSQEAKLPRGPARRTAVYNDLLATARSSQAAALDLLGSLKAQGQVQSWESLFLPNAISIRVTPGASQAVTDALRGVANVQAVVDNKLWWTEPAQEHEPTDFTIPGTEWGVQAIGADRAWGRGYTGAGVTVGVVDTGLDASHPALRAQYRGTNADGTQSHDYNWLDAVNGRRTPYDDGQHGTHVAGTVAGRDGQQTTGVAPGARVIAAKAIVGSGYNTTDATFKALQFMLAPTKTDGSSPDPARGADVVNNSWGTSNISDDSFVETWDGLLAAGIEIVSAAGNSGPVGKIAPPGSYPGALSVAATTATDKVAGFSSRGPSRFAPTAVLPNVAAPGASIRSTIPGGGYATFSGTSMASPHVAGAVALLLQAKPNATHEQIVAALEKTAVDIDLPGPDTAAGHGRIDVDRAIDRLIASPPPPPPPPPPPA